MITASCSQQYPLAKLVVVSPQSCLKRDAREQVGARSLASLIPVSSMKKMKRAEQFSDDTDQPPRQQQCVRIGTEEVPLDTEELYYNQLHWAY